MLVTIQDLVRKLDFLEKILLYCERKNIFKCISISVEIRKPLTDDVVFGSLRNLVLKYPLLSSFPEGQGPDIEFRPLDQVLFKDVYVVNESVTQMLNDDGSSTLELTSLSFQDNHAKRIALWKIIYYKNTGWLTFHSSHCFTDGGSVLAYLKDFVEGLNQSQESIAREVLYSLEEDMHLLENGISPSVFECVGYKPDYFTKITLKALKLIIHWWPGVVESVLLKQQHNLFFVGCPSIPFSRETCFESDFIIEESSPLNSTVPYFINFPTEILKEILRACRKEKVKLLTYLIIVYTHTIHQIYPGVHEDKYLKAVIPVSFRNISRNLISHETYLGNEGRFDDGFYTYGVAYFLEPQLKFSWDIVRKYHQHLHDTINREDWNKEFYVACQSMEAEHYMGGRFEKKGDCSFMNITNLGHIEVLDHGKKDLFQIDDIVFVPSVGATMGTHHITVCSTLKNGINIGFSNGDHRITDWKLFKENFAANLLEFSGVRSG